MSPMYSKATSSMCRNGIHRACGVTLIELVVVMSLLAIISVVAAVTLRDPVRAYLDTNRRTDLADSADTALRRIAREVRIALPNSVRVTGVSPIYLELLLTRTGGRYRAQTDGSSAGNILDFTAGDSAFDMLGPLATEAGQAIGANDMLVVHNLFGAASVTKSNAYTFNQSAYNCTSATPDSADCNSARITGTAAGLLPNEARINFDARRFPLASPGNRFHVVSGPVTYVCAPGPADANGDGTGTITRVSNYSVQLAQPTGAWAGTPVSAVLARNVTACEINYDPLVVAQSRGLVSMRIALTRGNETVNLHHAVHVSNVP
ncbi:MAG: type II secretion system protein J [Burkholderiales bacterium]